MAELPAFPTGNGMTLRDWFAGQFMAGAAASRWFTDHAHHGDAPSDTYSGLAANAYAYADAMLEARNANANRESADV